MNCKYIATSLIQNPEPRTQNPESRIQNPESRIQNPESRIQDETGLAALARVQHDADGEGDAAVQVVRLVVRQVEHVAVEKGQLAVEFPDDVLRVALEEDEVSPEQAEERSEETAQEGEDQQVLLDDAEERPVGAVAVPALPEDVVEVVLHEPRQDLPVRVLHRVVRAEQRPLQVLLDRQEPLRLGVIPVE